MLRSFAVAIVLWCFTATVSAQTQPAPATRPPQAGTAAIKPVAKKSPPKAKTSAKPAAAAETGACRIGVIPAIGDFVVQKVGLTVFGNEQVEVPIEAWGLDDLVVARVRAAAPGAGVRKIAYARETFDPWYHGRGTGFFNNPGDNLTAVVRPIAANANCERYVVVTKSKRQLPGTNQILDGVGVYTNWTNGLSKRGALFTYIQVTVFDGKTFVIHEDPFANIGARLAASLSRMTKDDSIRSLDNFESPASTEAVANNATLRDGARALLAEQLDKVMPAYLKEE